MYSNYAVVRYVNPRGITVNILAYFEFLYVCVHQSSFNSPLVERVHRMIYTSVLVANFYFVGVLSEFCQCIVRMRISPLECPDKLDIILFQCGLILVFT
jgi:hypothetical protein